ncbi:MAG: rubrerythrin family protein [Halobacteriales archaeon]|nr:rubrerythrin family protein [Halobacteriales archaeon]
MDTDTFLETIEADRETELSRLGSSKAIYAVTEGDMETEAVLATIADAATTAGATFADWATAAEPDAERASVYETVAETLDTQADRLADAHGDHTPTATPRAPESILQDQDEPIDRLSAAVAWTLVTDRTMSQAVGFFVGNADTRAADLFRDLRTELEDERDRLLGALAGACETDADWEQALEAARAVVDAAYDEYVETLEGMGIKVKPVC